MNRKILVFLVSILVLSLLASCAVKDTPSTGGQTDQKSMSTSTPKPVDSTPAPSEENVSDGKYAPPIVDEPLTLTVLQYIRDTDPISVDDNLWWVKHLEELTNIKAKYTQVNAANWEQQVTLMFASNDLTDIINSAAGNINQEIYGVDQGILVPVDELVDQYMPIYKAQLDADPEIASSLKMSDGKMYGIGRLVTYGSNHPGEFFINKIWLDELGLELPKTTDELYEALKAFVASDPNRVGYQGIFDELTTYFLWMWGIPESTSRFSITDEGQVVFNATLPGYREAVEFMHKLYSEGLMDKAVITQDSNTKIGKYNENNLGLSTMHRLKAMGWDPLVESMVFLPPPAAPGYNVKVRTDMSAAVAKVFFTASNEHLEESAKWVDYQMADQLAYESFYGPEGILWNWNDEGKCELGPEGDQGSFEYALNVNNIFYMTPEHYNKTFQQPDYRIERIEYSEFMAEQGYLEKYPNAIVTSIAPKTAEDQTIIDRAYANIKALYDQAIADMIMNGVDDKKWETFLSNLQNAGMEDYIGTYQKIFDNYMSIK
jgi:putative aldouronate transport system substrate-binding protein